MNAYTLISGSETAYSAAAEQVSSALNTLPSRVTLVRDTLAQYEIAAAAITDTYLKGKADEIYLLINNTLTAAQPSIISAMQVSIVLLLLLLLVVVVVVVVVEPFPPCC